MIIFLSMIPVGLLGQKNGTNDEDLNRAITLETVKDYAGAFELYMKYESVHPASQEAFSGMSRNAVRAGKMDGYRDLVLERFAEYPENRLIAKYAIECLYKSGRSEDVRSLGEECLRRWPNEQELYRNISTLYRSINLIDEAVDVLEAGRTFLKKDTLYSREMAELLLRNGDYRKSTIEFLHFLEDHPRSVSYVERRLLETGTAAGDTSLIVDLVRKTESTKRCGWAFPLLIDLEIAEGSYRSALARIERCSEGRNPDETLAELLRLVRISIKSGDTDVVDDALDAAGALSAGVRPDLQVQFATELADLGKYEEALTRFETMVEGKLSTANKIKCYETIGDLYLEARHDPRQAIHWYRKLDEEGVLPEHTMSLRLKVARALLIDGELESALPLLLLLDESPVGGTVKDDVTFEIANSYFYEGQLDEAESYYRKLAEASPTFEGVNEALGILRLIHIFGESEKEALRLYGSASYADRRGEREQCRDLFNEAYRAAGDQGLVDELQYIMAEALERWERPNEALALYEEVAGRAEEEYLAARALMQIGRMQFFVFNEPKAAKDSFEKLILNYEGVIEIEEARHLLARIEGRI